MNLKNLLRLTFLLAFVALFTSNTFAQTTYFVDVVAGNDAYTGTSNVFVSGNVGPKKSIQAMIDDPAVVGGDLIEIEAGTYNETVSLTKTVELYTSGGGVIIQNLTLNTVSTTNTNIAESGANTITVANTLAILSGDYVNNVNDQLDLAAGGTLEIGYSSATYTGLSDDVNSGAGCDWLFNFAGSAAYGAAELASAQPNDVTVSTTGTLAIPAPPGGGPAGDLTISNGATLNITGINIAVGGDFVNNGAYYGGAGDQIQIGGGDISGTGTFMDLAIGGASTLSSDITFVNIDQVTASTFTVNAALDMDGFSVETPGDVALGAAGNLNDTSVGQTSVLTMSGTAGDIGLVTLTLTNPETFLRFTVDKPSGSIVQLAGNDLTVDDQFLLVGGIFDIQANNFTLGNNHTNTATIGGNLNGTGLFKIDVQAGDVTTDGAGAINTPMEVDDGGFGNTYTFTELITIGNNLLITDGTMVTSSLALINGSVTVNGGALTLNTSDVAITNNVTLADGTVLDGTSNITINGTFTSNGNGAGTDCAVDKDGGTMHVAGNVTLNGDDSFKADGLSTTTGNVVFADGAVDINGNLDGGNDVTFAAGDADIAGTATAANDFITGAGNVNVDGILTVGNDLYSNAGVYTYKGTGQNTVGNDIIASAVNVGAPALRFYGPVDVGNDGRCAGVAFGQAWRFDGEANFTGNLDFDNLTVGNTAMTVDFYADMSATQLLLNDDLAHAINFNDASTPVGQLEDIIFKDLVSGTNAAATITVNSTSATSYYFLNVSGDITIPANVTSVAITVDPFARVVLNGTGDLDAAWANAQEIDLTGQALKITNLEIANEATDSDLTTSAGGNAEKDDTKEAVYITGGNNLTVNNLWLTSNGILGGVNLVVGDGAVAGGGVVITRSGGSILTAFTNNGDANGETTLTYKNQTDITTGTEYTVVNGADEVNNFNLTGTGGKVTLTANLADVHGVLTVDDGRELAMTNGANDYTVTVVSDGDATGDKIIVNGDVTGVGPLILEFNDNTNYDIEGTGSSISNLLINFTGRTVAAVLDYNGPSTLTGDFTTIGGDNAGIVNWGAGAPAVVGVDMNLDNDAINFSQSVTVTGDLTQTEADVTATDGTSWFSLTVGGDYDQDNGDVDLGGFDITGAFDFDNDALTMQDNGVFSAGGVATWNSAGVFTLSVDGDATFGANFTMTGGTFAWPATNTADLHLQGAMNSFTTAPLTFTFANDASGRVVFDGAAAQQISIQNNPLTVKRVGINNAAGVSVTSIAQDWNVQNLLLADGLLTHNGLLDMQTWAGPVLNTRIVRDAGTIASFPAFGPDEVEYIGAADVASGKELVNTLDMLMVNGTGTYTLDKDVTILTGGTVNLSKGVLAAGAHLITQTACTIQRAEGSITGTPNWGTNQTLEYYNTVNDLVAGPEWTNDGNITTYNQNSPGKKVTLAGDVMVDGPATILFGTLDVATFTLDVSGNLTADGTNAFTTGVDGKILLTGAAANFGGTATAFPNVEVDKTTANAVTFNPTLATADWTFDSFTGTDGALAIAVGGMDDITILGDFTVGPLFDAFNLNNSDDWFFQGDFTWNWAAATSGALTQNNPAGPPLPAAGANVFTMSGTTAQTVTCTNPGLEVFAVNNAAGVDLGSDLALDDAAGRATLVLTSGAVRTGAFSVQYGLAGVIGTWPVPRTDGYVDGNFWAFIDSDPVPAAITHTFPMGTENDNDNDGNPDYRPFSLGFAAGGVGQNCVVQVQHVDAAPVGTVGIPLTSGGVTVNKMTPAYWMAGFYDATNTNLQTPTQNPTVTLGADGFIFGDITKIRALYRLTNVANTWLIPGTYNGSFYSIGGMPTVVHSGVQGWTLEPQQLFVVGYESVFAVVNEIPDMNLDLATVETYTDDLSDNYTGNLEPDGVQFAAVSSDPAVATVAIVGTELTVTPVADGTTTVTVTYTDTNGDEITDTFDVTVTTATNVAPVFADVPGDITLTEASTLPYTFTFTATDGDGDALTFAIEAPVLSGAAIDATTGEFTYTPTSNGTFTVTVTVTDTESNVATYTFTIVVDDVVGIEDLDEIPTEFSLSQNYPNPFNPTTTIRFSMPEAANVVLKVYNVLGQEVATLLNNDLSAGYHEIQFDASNLNSGMYIYKIQAGSFVSIKKMMLTK